MKEIKIRFVCKDLSGDIFFLYHTIDEFINGFNLAQNGRIETIISKDLFTGLLDKNGKEIYDGDILQFKIYDEEKERRGILQWNQYEYTIINKQNKIFESTDYIRILFLYSNKYITVSGNIYQNLGLLSKD